MARAALLVACVLATAATPARATDDKPKDRPPAHAKHDGPKRGGPTPEDVSAMLDVLREMEPDLAKDIDKWREDKPDRVGEIIQRRFPRLRNMVDTKRNDPELYALRLSDIRLSRQSRALVRAYHTAWLAKDEEADSIRADLRESLTQQFEVRQQIRQRELRRFEQRIAQMRKELEERAAGKDRLVDGELKKLLQEREAKVETANQ